MGRDRRFWPLKADFFAPIGNSTGGIPSHGTLARVTALINADQLQTAFAEWMKACHDVTDTKTTQASKFTRLPGHHRRHGMSEKDRGKRASQGRGLPPFRQNNQSKLVKAFEQAFPVSELAHFKGDAYVTNEKNRGRQETRHHIIENFTEQFQ
jgi:predicted transposase YbfD/YdcC